VVPVFQSPERSPLYDIVRVVPLLRGENQYQIKCRHTGRLRLIGETEIKAAFS